MELLNRCLGVCLAFAVLPVSMASEGPGPCSHTGTVQTAAANLITTAKSTDCNNDGILDCGYEEIMWPAIFGCGADGSMLNHCCETFVAFSQKRVFACGGANCATVGWLNDQPFTQAKPVPCNGNMNEARCTK